MENRNKVTLKDDGSLILSIDGLDISLEKGDYFKSDKGKILIKHQTIMYLTHLLKIKVGEPVLMSNSSPTIYVIARRAERGNETYTALGESNTKNLFCDMMLINPATTADNRAYDRAVLGVLGVYGDVYGSSEINYKDNEEPITPTPKKSETKQETTAVQAEIKMDESPKAINPTEDNPFWWNDTGKGLYTDRALDPQTFIVTEGPNAGKNWTTRQLYDYDYKSCLYFAERTKLEEANDSFKKQVYSCRRAIREYGLKSI